MPPDWAMAIAICASVTVSIAEAMIGILSRILRVMDERTSTSAGITSDRPGFNSTSSKVYASGGKSLEVTAIANSAWPEITDQRIGVNASRTRELRILARLDGPLLGW